MAFDWFKAARESQPSMVTFSKEEVIAAGEYLAFSKMPYFHKFLGIIEDRATRSGITATTADEALISIGERRALLGLVAELAAEAKTAEVVLRASLTQAAADADIDTESSTTWSD